MSVQVKRGFWRTRGGKIAEVVGRSMKKGLWLGLIGDRYVTWDDGGDWSRTDSHNDLVEYLGETLRRLPDSPGWWWYENAGNPPLPLYVLEEFGKLFIANGFGPVEAAKGRWGNKIEPSGFEPAEPATGTAQGTDARTEAKS